MTPLRFQHHSAQKRVSRRPRRGAIFVTALGIIVILSGMVLVFAQSMQSEATTSANRLSYAQANAVEQGAEYWVLANVEAYAPDAITISEIPAEAVPVGGGYFWLLSPNPTTDQTYNFGIVDEAGKVNLNVVGPKSLINPTNLINLPNMTEETADAISDWHNPANQASSDGAESDYYNDLGYNCKNGPYETVEELLLVKGVDKGLLFGLDLNRDGVVTDAERQIGGGANAQMSAISSAFNGGQGLSRGIFEDLTVYSTDPNKTSTGGSRANVTTGQTKVESVLKKALGASKEKQIIDAVYFRDVTETKGGGKAGGKGGGAKVTSKKLEPRRPPSSVAGFLTRALNRGAMTNADIKSVIDKLTASTGKTTQGLINVNTASEEVLMTLNGLTQSDADALISQRNNESDLTTIGWVFDALPQAKALGIVNQITARSFQYSGDIVAVSGDGRAYKRVRIVVDASSLPAKIVYRRDLTSVGWPLADDIRATLRSGQKLPTPTAIGPVQGNTGLP